MSDQIDSQPDVTQTSDTSGSVTSTTVVAENIGEAAPKIADVASGVSSAGSAVGAGLGGFVTTLFSSGLIGKLIDFLILVVGEVFAEKKAAREANQKFQLEQEKFNEIAQRSLQKMLDDARKAAAVAQDGEDQLEKAKQDALKNVSS
jgi:hypothetical protein